MKSSTSLLIMGTLCSLLIAINAEKKECPMKKALKESVEACKNKLSDENQELLKKDEKSDNEEIRCFKACVMNHSGILKEAKLQMAKIEELVNENIEEENRKVLMAAFEDCRVKVEVSENECEVAGLFEKCFEEFKEPQ